MRIPVDYRNELSATTVSHPKTVGVPQKPENSAPTNADARPQLMHVLDQSKIRHWNTAVLPSCCGSQLFIQVDETGHPA